MLPSNIRQLVDGHFHYLAQKNLNWINVSIPSDMALGEMDEDEFIQWHPIPSSVTGSDLASAAEMLGAPISPQYASVLQYMHFMELQIGDLGFFAHPSTGWREVLEAHVFRGHPKALLLDKGFLPFAFCSDWGLYCFRLDEETEDGEFAIYRWDHDDPQWFERISSDLYGALAALGEK